MDHYDDEELALLALGERLDTSDPSHLHACLICTSRLEELTSTVAIARSIGPDDRLQDPPPSIWAAIQQELASSDSGQIESASSTVTDLADVRRSRARSSWLLVAAAALIGVIVGGAATVGIINAPREFDVVATGDLAPVGGSQLSGTARVESGDAGAVLTVDIPGLPTQADGYYEVWMATSDAKTMVAVGTVSPGEQASLHLPAGMNITAFPLVDVSVEHFDGNTAHSAESLVRGQLHS